MEQKMHITTKKYSGDTTVVSLRLPTELVERINEVCDKTRRTKNELIISCVEFALDNIVIDDDK